VNIQTIPQSNSTKKTKSKDFQIKLSRKEELKTKSRWWFQTFYMFIPSWGDDPI